MVLNKFSDIDDVLPYFAFTTNQLHVVVLRTACNSP